MLTSFPRWMFYTFSALFVLLLVVLIMVLSQFLSRPYQTMQVSGVGRVAVVPDIAVLSIGVTSQGVNAEAVQAENTKKINNVIQFIKNNGVKGDNIQTSGFYASPRYNYTNGQQSIVGYESTQMITIKVDALDKSKKILEAILAGVINAGANQIQGIRFNFSDPEAFHEAARKQAIQRAKEKAHALASEARLNLGRVVNIIDSGDDSYPTPLVTMSYAQKAEFIKPDIELGKQEITERVTLVFAVQ